MFPSCLDNSSAFTLLHSLVCLRSDIFVYFRFLVFLCLEVCLRINKLYCLWFTLQPLMHEYEEHVSKMDALNDIGNKCGGMSLRTSSPSRRTSSSTREYSWVMLMLLDQPTCCLWASCVVRIITKVILDWLMFDTNNNMVVARCFQIWSLKRTIIQLYCQTQWKFKRNC